jgi:Na+/melibiose symporter-like transporter
VTACVVLYIVSAATIITIRKPEPAPEPGAIEGSPFAKIGEGLRLIVRNPIMRSVMSMVSLFNFTYAAYLAIYVVYLPVGLKLHAWAVGLVLAATGPGLLIGATFSSWLPKRFGYGRVMLTAGSLSSLFLIGVSQVRGNGAAAITLLFVLNFVYGAFSQTFNVSMSSIRQSITPDRLLGRVMATYRFFGVGPVPLGSILGGLLAEQVGLRTSLFSLSIAMAVVSALFLFSALRGVGTELPEPAEL